MPTFGSGVDRTQEFRQWLDIASSQTKSEKCPDNPLAPPPCVFDPHELSVSRPANFAFYESIKAIQDQFELLVSVYPLEHDQLQFQLLAKQLKEMLSVAENLSYQHEFKDISNGDQGTWSTNFLTSYFPKRQEKSKFDKSHTILPSSMTYQLVLKHRKRIVETIHSQLVSYLQRVDQIRKDLHSYSSKAFFVPDKNAAERRKRLGELLKAGYSTVHNDETRRIFIPANIEDRNKSVLRCAKYNGFQDDIRGDLRDRSMLLSARNFEDFEDTVSTTFIRAIFHLDECHDKVDTVIYEQIVSEPVGDVALPSADMDSTYFNAERAEMPPSPMSELRDRSAPAATEPNEMLQLDDLITSDQPFIHKAHQSMSDVSSMLSIFVEHLGTQADAASELLHTTEASTELINDAIVQLKQAINRTQSRQLYFILAFAFMSSFILASDIIL